MLGTRTYTGTSPNGLGHELLTTNDENGMHVAQIEAKRLGLPPPPARFHLKFIRGPHHWTLLIRAKRESDALIRQWLAPLDPRIGDRRADSVTPQVLRATLQRLPEPMADLFGMVRVSNIIAEPNGPLLVRFHGSLQDLTAWAQRPIPTSTTTIVGIPSYHPVLSDRQHEALRFAVQNGYYDLPRRTNLRRLATAFGLSAAALSELLRRAEGHMVKKYVAETNVNGFRPRANGAKGEKQPLRSTQGR